VHVVLTDLMMPGTSGLDLLKALNTVSPDAEVVLMTAYGTVEAEIVNSTKRAGNRVVTQQVMPTRGYLSQSELPVTIGLGKAAQADEAPDARAFVDSRWLILPENPELQIHDLRALATKKLLGRPALAVLAQAKSILHYHATHRFCARCGAATRSVAAGWRRDCPSCGARDFPRTDPVAIMLVVDGDNCLLGRARHFPDKMYSCLAGFVESGETLEEAVRREVMEEAGIVVGKVSYVASQPWPFPASLMFGCRARALSREITMDANELEDCRWFSRAEARAMIEERHAEEFFAPAKIAIARALLEQWLAEDLPSIAQPRAQKSA